MESSLKKILLVCTVAAVFAAGIYWFHYVPDDAYIGFRYAANAARGEGLVFNPGERVEGYTNFLWVVILAAVSRAGLPTAGTARVLGLLLSTGTLLLSWRTCTVAAYGTRNPRRFGVGAAAAPLILAASAPFAVWALSGTEIPLFTLLLTAGMYLLAAGKSPRAVFAVFALLALTRPEGTVYFLLAALLLAARGERVRDVAVSGAMTAGILLFPFLLWKLYYYGHILPNTFFAKTGPAAMLLRNGAAYTLRFAAWHIWLPAAAILLTRVSKEKDGEYARLTVPVSILALNWLIVTVLGGDWMPQFRLMVPTIPAMAVMAGAAVQSSRSKGGAARLSLAVVLMCLAMAPGSSGYDTFLTERAVVRTFSRLGKRLGEILPAGTSLACGSTGAIGYFSGLPMVDILGLTEPEIARHGKIVSSQPGHMKALGSHVLDRRPDLLLLGNIQIHRGSREEDLERIKVQEMDIILDPRFAAQYEFVNLPLGNGIYLSCYRRTGSPAFSE